MMTYFIGLLSLTLGVSAMVAFRLRRKLIEMEHSSFEMRQRLDGLVRDIRDGKTFLPKEVSSDKFCTWLLHRDTARRFHFDEEMLKRYDHSVTSGDIFDFKYKDLGIHRRVDIEDPPLPPIKRRRGGCVSGSFNIRRGL